MILACMESGIGCVGCCDMNLVICTFNMIVACELKAVSVQKAIEVFISRLDASTDVAEVKENITQIVEDCNLQTIDISVEQLPVKYAGYSSFHVIVVVSSIVFRDVLKAVMCADVCPVGTIVRQFFIKSTDGSG